MRKLIVVAVAMSFLLVAAMGTVGFAAQPLPGTQKQPTTPTVTTTPPPVKIEHHDGKSLKLDTHTGDVSGDKHRSTIQTTPGSGQGVSGFAGGKGQGGEVIIPRTLPPNYPEGFTTTVEGQRGTYMKPDDSTLAIFRALMSSSSSIGDLVTGQPYLADGKPNPDYTGLHKVRLHDGRIVFTKVPPAYWMGGKLTPEGGERPPEKQPPQQNPVKYPPYSTTLNYPAGYPAGILSYNNKDTYEPISNSTYTGPGGIQSNNGQPPFLPNGLPNPWFTGPWPASEPPPPGCKDCFASTVLTNQPPPGWPTVSWTYSTVETPAGPRQVLGIPNPPSPSPLPPPTPVSCPNC